MDKIDRLVKFIREEGGIVNNVGDGKIAGTIEGSNYDPNFSPPVNKKKKKRDELVFAKPIRRNPVSNWIKCAIAQDKRKKRKRTGIG